MRKDLKVYTWYAFSSKNQNTKRCASKIENNFGFVDSINLKSITSIIKTYIFKASTYHFVLKHNLVKIMEYKLHRKTDCINIKMNLRLN